MAKIFNFENTEFDIQNFPNPIFEDINWSRSGDDNQSKMHSISSYLAMFAPALPKYFITRLTKEHDLIFDPFSGRGTTALKAREMNRRFIGSDLNPYAIVLSRSKVANTTIDELIKEVNKWEKEFIKWSNLKENITKDKLLEFKELTYFYSSKNLKQLIFLREKYGKKWRKFNEIQNAIFGFILGLMHGPMRKDKSTIYFSLNMPNTLSMAPNYVKEFAKKNNLVKPENNIFKLIKDRIYVKFDNNLSKKFKGRIDEVDALSNNNKIKNNSVDLLITSPPYLSIVNYTRSNWLKLWLLGYERQKLSEIKLSDKLKFNSYVDFIASFLNNVYSKIKVGGHVALVVGDVYKQNLIEQVWDNIAHRVQFNLISIYWDDSYLQNKKTTNMLNNRKGKATKIDKVLLLRK